jgi:tRNA nucleotidyltransferase/poly(A) polymerase
MGRLAKSRLRLGSRKNGLPLAGRKNGLPLRSPAAARAALTRRADVRVVATLARERGDEVRVVGGAVRDAFLGRSGGDLDLTLPSLRALPFAQALGGRFGTRAVVVGAERRRIIRLPTPHGEIEIWESEGREGDRDRRDFTVNALSFDLLTRLFDGPATAFEDLARRRLALPREGVLEEDPVRVLRAARFEVELAGFRLVPSALPEVRRAAGLLPHVAAERCLAELTKILSGGNADSVQALKRLEAWGALAALIPGSAASERRAGIRNVGRAGDRALSPEVARALLLRPLGEARALAVLASWKVSRQELRLATRLLRLSTVHRGAAGARDVVAWIRESAPFVTESLVFLEAIGEASGRRLAAALRRIVVRPARLARILAPARALSPDEVKKLLRLGPGPELGRALEALDRAAATGEVKGRAGAVRFVLSRVR